MKTQLATCLFLLGLVHPAWAQVSPGSVVEESIASVLSTPAQNHVKDVPVIIVRYLPTQDGVNIDVAQATDYWSLGQITIDALKANINNYDKRVKFALEEGSRFHGYKDSSAVPYLGYRVVRYITVYRQIQCGLQLGQEGGKNVYQPDYKKEFDDLGLTAYIDAQGVKEVWMWYGEPARPNWPSYSAAIHGGIQKSVTFVESNMASPTTGDISNSARFADDLHVVGHTYVVYCQNFRRTQAEAIHNHGHQLEAMYKYTAQRQDGNFGLFVQKFSGWGNNNYSVPPIGRAGDCHHPPNTKVDYDYLNATLVESDIEDWRPAGGTKRLVNVNTWGDLVYRWPGDQDFSQRKETQWYVYWMQNMPGFNTRIPYDSNVMTNWWQLTADWDLCFDKKVGLYEPAPPLTALTLTPSMLAFGGTNTNGTLSPLTPAQTVTVGFSPSASASWTASASQSWVQITGGAGTGSGTFTVGIINPANVLAGVTTASATVTVTSSGASNSPQTVVVNLTLRAAAATTPPVGLVDTPLPNTTGVVGTIGVTGWVVDDVGVAGVKVYRNCLAFEPSSNCVTVAGRPAVFVGDATLVSGARPDVEALYPNLPQANRAAWGYLLLTNLLPHVPNQQMFGGQGAMTFSALATDVEGKQVWLGRTTGDTTATTITLANDTIAKPFGAIDTPAQGATVSGTFANFGWALTPDGNTSGGEAGDIAVPTDGSTLRVYLDGVPGATIAYNQCRGTTAAGPVPAGVWCNDDVASIFGHPTPQATFAARAANATKHRNLDVGRGAIGALLIDTTTLANGVHTIMWGVTDSAGRGEGLGSRYFTVLNAGADAPATPTPPAGDDGASPAYGVRPTAHGRTAGRADAFEHTPGLVRARTGLDLNAPFAVVPADEAGVRAVRIADLGRLELHVGAVEAGYLVANGERRDLPPGSHLDASTGIFTWAPGVGYLGTYRIVFVRAGQQIPIDVTIAPVLPAAPGESEIRMALDLPVSGATVSGSLRVAGWALDPQAAFGSGIEAVHVWAQRTDIVGADPQFLGAAALGGTRPDVVAIYGPQFRAPAFDLMTAALEPGQYDVTAYVRCARTGRWEDARTVTVTMR